MKTAMRTTLTGVILLLTMGVASTLRAQSNSPLQYFYDDLGRLVKAVDQNGNVATYSSYRTICLLTNLGEKYKLQMR